MVNTMEGREAGRVETGREKVGAGESGQSRTLKTQFEVISEWIIELPAYACALHPTMACWAWSGRSSRIAIRQISTPSEGKSSTNGLVHERVGRGPLGGEGKVVETGKGKFGMDVKFVSRRPLSNAER